jgi:hypothetical protein
MLLPELGTPLRTLKSYGESRRGVAFNLTSLMLGYPVFKVIGMSGIVRIIRTPQNVNPETHSLLLLAPDSSSSVDLTLQSPSTKLRANGIRMS